METTLEE
jgi:hypothetical protein